MGVTSNKNLEVPTEIIKKKGTELSNEENKGMFAGLKYSLPIEEYNQP